MGTKSGGSIALSDCLLAALPLVATVAVYSVVLTAGFVWDDYALIIDNPQLDGGGSLWAHFVRPFWSSPLVSARAFYRPLITISYAIEREWWGERAAGYHVTNLIVHLLCTFEFMLLCRKFRARWRTASLLGALFALSPRLTESVAWISGRTDPAATVFVLAALLVYSPGRGSWGRKFIAAALIWIGLLCKEVALAGLLALAAYEWSWSARARLPMRHRLIQLAPLAASGISYAVLRTIAFATVRVPHFLLPPLFRMVLPFEAVGRYLLMLLDPLRPRLQIGSITDPRYSIAALGFLVVVTLVILLIRVRRVHSPENLLLFVLGGAALGLVLQFVPLDVNVVAADRFLYLPLATILLSASAYVDKLIRRCGRSVVLALLLLIASFAGATTFQAGLWSDEAALWRQTIKLVPPNNQVATCELAVVLIKRDRCAEAIAILDAARSTGDCVRYNRVECLEQLGRRTEAVDSLESLLEERPDSLRYRMSLYVKYARSLRFDDARAVAKHLRGVEIPEKMRQTIVAFEEIMHDWSSLPPEVDGEPVEWRWQRAQIFERFGATDEAVRRYKMLAVDRAVPMSLRLHAAGYLSLHGGQSETMELLDLLEQQEMQGVELEPLREAITWRFSD